jgi:signal transduction histidine kinase/CheY-like chemotaxis protein
MLYFGCDTVVTFDGHLWRSLGLKSTYAVRALSAGPGNKIWVGGVNEIGVFLPDGLSGRKYQSLTEKIPPGEVLGDVWRVYPLGEDEAIYVAREKVLLWKDGKFTIWPLPGGRLLVSNRASSGLYLHYPPQGLFRLGEGGLTLELPTEVIGSSPVRWVDDSGTSLHLVTDEGIKLVSNGFCRSVESAGSTFIRKNLVTAVAGFSDGTLAVGTLLGGVVLLDRFGEITRVIDERSGLPNKQVYSLFIDRDRALWAMGPSYIVRIEIDNDTLVFSSRGLHSDDGFQGAAELDHRLYFVSPSGLFRLTEPENPLDLPFISLAEAHAGGYFCMKAAGPSLLLGGADGLAKWDIAGPKPLGSDTNPVFRLFSRGRGRQVVMAAANRIEEVDPDNGNRSLVAEGLPDYADSMAVDGNGKIWVGTPSSGIFRVDAEYRRAISAVLPNTTKGAAIVGQLGKSIIVFTDNKLFRKADGKESFEAIPGFPRGTVTTICSAEDKLSVWVVVDPEGECRYPRLVRLTEVNESVAFSIPALQGIPALGTVQGLYIQKTPFGDSLWACGTEALVRFGPSAIANPYHPRKPEIFLQAHPEPVDLNRIAFDQSPLVFEFAAYDYGMRDFGRFQTRISGAESDWQQPTQFQRRTIAGLREGSYSIEARTFFDNGEVGSAATIPIRILPPWWRTNWAYAALMSITAFGVVVLLRIRSRSLARRARELEELVRERTAQLEKANAAKTDFVASMSHEIRNPMGGIIGTTLELAETPLDSRQKELVTTLRHCATFLSSLVEDVLDFAQIESGAFKIARSPFSPQEVIDATVRMVATQAKEIPIEVMIDGKLPTWISGDPARVQQVLVNFITNALKFGSTKIEVSVSQEQSFAVFAVKDDGGGISPSDIDRLFVRFSRLKSPRISSVPGTGLGLAVCRVLAERMGGSVGVESTPGKGAKFLLRVPLEEAIPKTERPHAIGLSSTRALVVEDIDYNARALGMMLQKMGFQIDYATDGREALTRLVSVPYGIAFLDSDLPGLKGPEIARSFRAINHKQPRTLLYATTAYSTARDRDECLEAGMDGFIAKPITPKKLSSIFNKSADNRQILAEDVVRSPTGLDLTLLKHLAGPGTEALRVETNRFVESLEDAMRQFEVAAKMLDHPAIRSAAHRLLSHAKSVADRNLQDAATVVQESGEKLSPDQVEMVARQVRGLVELLKQALERSGHSEN